MIKKKIVTIMTALIFLAMSMFVIVGLSACSDEEAMTYNAQVVAGFAHSVVLRDDGTVWGWGRNEEGQLGNGNRINQARPVRFRIEPFTHQGTTWQPPDYIVQIASHKIHTMALGNDGSVWAGGWNQEGQLGAPVGCRMTPIRVPFQNADTRIVDIDAGMLFSIALSDQGHVYGWGRNRHEIMMSEVNNAIASQRINMLARATRIQGAELYDIVQIAAGHEHVLALREDGAVIGWGRNRNGQVGDFRHPIMPPENQSPTEGIMSDGLLWDVTLPRVIPNLPSDPNDRVVRVIGGGFHSLALTEAGHVYVWGRSDRGQIGDGFSHIAREADGVTKRVHPPYLMQAGQIVYQNGVRVPHPQRGQYVANSSQSIPQRIILPEGRRAVYVAGTSGDSNAAILDNGQVIVWGRNQEGQLGIGSVENIREDAFNAVPSLALRAVGLYLENIVSIAVGETHMTAICGETGEALSWGTNWDGELGNAGIMASLDALQVQRGIRGPSLGGSPPHVIDTEALTGIRQLASGHLFSLALDGDGFVHGWGRNNHGQLLMMHSNDHYVATRLEDFRVNDNRFPNIQTEWMQNMGQTRADANFAVLDGVSAIAAGTDIGFSFGIAIRNGFAYGWGDNESGMLGHGYEVNRRRTLGDEPKDNNPRPMIMHDRTTRVDAIAVAAGGRHSLILRQNRQVYATGNGGAGRLGDGFSTTRNYPTRVAFADGIEIESIDAGGARSFAIDTNGYLWAWGNGSYGRLGNGISAHSYVPVRVLGPSIISNERVIQVAAGDVHTLALTASGRVFSWGAGWNGRLGHGNGDSLGVPTHISAVGLNHADHRIEHIAVGGAHSIAIRSDGTVWTWGDNGSGQLGRNTNWSQQIAPGIVSGITNATKAAGGSANTVVLRGEHGAVYAWGTNAAGALGSGGRQDAPSREAIQQNPALEGTVLITPNRQLSAVRALGVSANYAFFSAHRADLTTSPGRMREAKGGMVRSMSGAAIFFMWLGIVLGVVLIALIVLFILDNRRVIDIKWPPFLRKFFDMIPIKRKGDKAKAGASGAKKKKGSGVAKSKSGSSGNKGSKKK